MSILVTEKDPAALRIWRRGYLLTALMAFLFGMIYEHFSHEVYSAYMIYAFVFPLAGGVLPCFLIDRSGKTVMPGVFLFDLYTSGIATLTIGSIVTGVLEIYGTTNRLTVVYWFAGAGFAAAAVVLYFAAFFLRRS